MANWAARTRRIGRRVMERIEAVLNRIMSALEGAKSAAPGRRLLRLGDILATGRSNGSPVPSTASHRRVVRVRPLLDGLAALIDG